MSACALRTDGAGDSTPASDVGERITRLFPKCRPKNMQHHHERLTSALEGRDTNNVNNVSSDEEQNEGQLVILNAKGGTYKLRDSRIIEIAGGRELYSQSRTKAVRKLRHSNTHKHNIRNKVRALNKDTVDYAADNNTNNEIQIHRIINEPKKMISRHTSPSYTNGDRDPIRVERERDIIVDPNNMGIPKNSSPILDPHKTIDVSTKSSPIAVVADGEVMVFDDNDDWKGLRTEPDASEDEIDTSVKRTLDNIKNGDCDIKDSEGSESSGEQSGSPDEDKRVARIIGELPIAEYEGSPRRYGTQKAARSPRPGFPQRIMTDTRDRIIPDNRDRIMTDSRDRIMTDSRDRIMTDSRDRIMTNSRDRMPDSDPESPTAGSAAFDYLYEFSETRKVLEEFFKGPVEGRQNADEIVNFQDLDYELRRQTQDCPSENGLDASSETEWPLHNLDVRSALSPHLQSNHTSHNFLGMPLTANLVNCEPSVRVGWSGAASPRRRERAPFPVSSDTSDSGSGSDMSLVHMDNDLADVHKVSMDMTRLPDACRMPVTKMPVVADAISLDGSDGDNNNQNHSSTVTVKEIVENGTSTEPHLLSDADLHSLDPLSLACGSSAPPPPAPAPHRPASPASGGAAPGAGDVESAGGMLPTIQHVTQHVPHAARVPTPHHHHHTDVYPPRKRPSSANSTESVEIKPTSGDEDEADTDLETDRLLGQQRTDDQGFFDDKGWRKPKSRTVMPAGSVTGSARSPPHTHEQHDIRDEDGLINGKDKEAKKKNKNKEDVARSVLIEGVLFRARYLGSTQLACEGQPTKATRMLQAEEAVSRIKAPEGENQPSTEVDLFISTEKIMVLNTELKEIMMDHALRTISYIADIGDLVVLMARRRFVPHETDSDQPKLNRTPKMICHVFESEEVSAQFIAQSIGQAFQVAYMEFLKANGIEDHSFVKEMDYQEVLNSQEIFGDELQMFAKKELQKEVVVPKTKGEILGVVVVESGWGSMLPTVVIANLAPAGAAARCGQLNIGDQIIAINGVSLVGLPLSTCQTYIKNSKNQTVVKLTVVPCAPVVEVKIKRPDTKYQLGFSVQNGVICSLLRGGIAERGGVRVGHRIIEINSQSVVAVPHERIVNLLATSVGEILMKTMPTSMFRLLTGQENPVFI